MPSKHFLVPSCFEELSMMPPLPSETSDIARVLEHSWNSMCDQILIAELFGKTGNIIW